MPRRRSSVNVRSNATARSDPFDLLMAEHELLRDQIQRARRDRGALEALGPAIRAHIERENRSLYPLCERLFGGPDGAVAVLREDHEAIEEHLGTIGTSYDQTGFTASIEAFALRLEDHLAREERVLFPLMAALLTGNDTRKLADLLRVLPSR
jgi:iron-sulfur cluster repair protein YtfE (RIC family)